MAKGMNYDAMLKQLFGLPSKSPDYTLGLTRHEWEIIGEKKRTMTHAILISMVDDGSWQVNNDYRPRRGGGMYNAPVYRPKKGWESGLMQAAVKKLEGSK